MLSYNSLVEWPFVILYNNIQVYKIRIITIRNVLIRNRINVPLLLKLGELQFIIITVYE